MARIGTWTGGWPVGFVLLALGCAGRAEKTGEARPTPTTGDVGSSRAGSADTGVGNDATAGGRPAVESQGSAGDPTTSQQPIGPCLGTIDELNRMGDVTCPTTWCDVADLANNCGSLSPSIMQVTKSDCLGSGSRWWSFDFQLTSGDHKICRYRGGQSFAEAAPELSEIELSSGTPRYCDGTSTRIGTSDAAPACSGTPTVLCDTNEQVVSGKPEPAERCISLPSQSCGTCCPVKEPDCSDEAVAAQYPGYGCVSLENRYCVCGCSAGRWVCGC